MIWKDKQNLPMPGNQVCVSVITGCHECIVCNGECSLAFGFATITRRVTGWNIPYLRQK